MSRNVLALFPGSRLEHIENEWRL